MIASISAIQAGDVNQTTVDIVGSGDDSTLQIENQTIFDNAESDTVGDGSKDVVKNQTELSSQSASISHKGSYNIVLKDSNSSAAISNRTINFNINNVNYQSTTDSNGVAGIVLDLNPWTI